MWNPPITDEKIAARRSVLAEAADLLADLVSEEARTIVFMKSRKAVELMARFAQLELGNRGRADLAERIAPYRAGYTPQQRRELEARLVAGELLGVVSTDALELGIDIGSLDAAICVTFPGTVASLRQMWGRAGRRGRGLALYVAGEDALDQFFCRHPDEFLDRPVEAAILDPFNEQVHTAHLLCAAHEGPLEDADAEFMGPDWRHYAEALVSAGDLRERPDGTFVPRHPEEFPAAAVSLRSASRDGVVIVDTRSGELIGTVDVQRAMTTVHDGAVYLHGGRSYEVAGLDLANRRALVQPFDGDWYTQPKKETDTYIERLIERRETLGVALSFGTVVVTEQVLAYQKKRLSDHEAIDLVALDLPQTSFATQALWYELDDEVAEPAARGDARRAARRRALPDRGAAAAGDVRPLGHRRPVDEPASADRRADDLHLRRPPRRDRDHPPGLRGVRGARRRRPPARLRVPVRERLPVVRAVAQVRQPERAAVQARLRSADGPDAGVVAVGDRLPALARPARPVDAGVVVEPVLEEVEVDVPAGTVVARVLRRTARPGR